MYEVSEVRILYIPCGSEEDARRLAHALLERRFIACANIYPSRSIYRWNGQMTDEVEHVVFAKTTADLAAQAAAAAEELHTYNVPCVLVLPPGSANAAYARWVAGEVSAGSGGVGAG